MDKAKAKRFFKESKHRTWFILYVICSTVYLFWRLFFTIPFGYDWVSIAAGIALLIVEALGLVEAMVHFSNMYNTKDFPKPEIAPEEFPDVDVFIATYNEEKDLLKKTILGCKRMDYPDKNKVHIYICDDGHRSEIKELAATLGVNYFDREDHKGNKAGNLNNALSKTTSPYIVTFDADMIPQSCFLLETIPYFVDAEKRNAGLKEDEKIKLGFLQSPQSFYDQDLFQFNLHSENKIPNEQDYFYRDIEVARNRTNSVIYGGSNTVISREALEAVGGFYTKAITEDFATGINIQKAGFVTLAISKRLASGLSAGTLRDLIQQRIRWARGVISTGRQLHIYSSSKLSFGQKINYWASIWYWYAPIKRFCYIMAPILYATFGFTVFKCNLWQVLLFWLPMYLTSNMALKTLSNNIRNVKWTSIYEYALFPYMLIPVLLESFGFSLKKFRVTDKALGDDDRQKGITAYKIPILLLIVLSLIGIVRVVITIFESGSLGPVVVLFWLIYNLFNMVMCMFFIDGRHKYRTAERVYAKVNGQLSYNGKTYNCVTKDMSENGMAVYIEKPVLIENTENDRILVTLYNNKWKANMWVDNKHTKEIKTDEEDKWLYSFSITEFVSEEDYDQYLALLYDRVTTNPAFIKKNNGVYDDLRTNIGQRAVTPNDLKREFPRIELNRSLPVWVEGKQDTVNVVDFNYEYFSTSTDCSGTVTEENKSDEISLNEPEEKEVSFVVGDIVIPTIFERKIRDVYLYKVKDFEKFYIEEHMRDRVMNNLLEVV